jgi:hypothetical protein
MIIEIVIIIILLIIIIVGLFLYIKGPELMEILNEKLKYVSPMAALFNIL